MNILITGAVTVQAHQLQRYLNHTGNITFADSVEMPFMLKNVRFVQIPQGHSQAFAHSLLTVCLDLKIERVYPLRKNELCALSEARQLFDEYGITILVPEMPFIDSLLNKTLKGEIVIKDGTVTDFMPDRGIFMVDPSTNEYRLFTAD
ncbi:MAG: hypothetical protein H7Y13_02115 [Sphingobacteriaceae bacterium]|nr:hypothetical protein [Sphingobacteriaceae bacterium]